MSVQNKSVMFFSIRDVCDQTLLKQYVLRFWEKKIRKLSPIIYNNKRFYRVSDIELILKIKDLRYNQGYTIEGVNNILNNKKVSTAAQCTNEAHVSDKKISENDALKTLKNKIEEMQKTIQNFQTVISDKEKQIEENSNLLKKTNQDLILYKDNYLNTQKQLRLSTQQFHKLLSIAKNTHKKITSTIQTYKHHTYQK